MIAPVYFENISIHETLIEIFREQREVLFMIGHKGKKTSKIKIKEGDNTLLSELL